MYLALYRTWRPQRFDEVVGQQAVVRTLKNALRANRLAHAYLFAGPRGTGKTSLAKILAKAVNCEQPADGEPCNACAACVGITQGSIVDVVEMDAASNRGVDEIRSVLEQVRYAPTAVRYKVYIIDEVHMLTTEAFNALLKTLEEPPSECLFLLATTDVIKVPATIASRCQRFDLSRVASDLVVARLRQVVKSLDQDVEDAALWMIARVTDGGMRDALSLLDQLLSYEEGRVDVESVTQLIGGIHSERVGRLVGALLRNEPALLLAELTELFGLGVDATHLLGELVSYLRDGIHLALRVEGADASDRVHYDPTFPVVVQQTDGATLLRMLETLALAQSEIRHQAQASVYFEVVLLSLLSEKATVRSSAAITADEARGARPEEQNEVTRLKEEIRALHARVAALEQSPPRRAAPPTASVAPSLRAAPPVPSSVLAERTQGVPPSERLPVERREDVADASVLSRSPSVEEALNGVDGESDPTLLKRIQADWNQILDAVREVRVQTRAWLADGRPEDMIGNTIYGRYAHALHASHVMKQVNLELIEEVLAKRYQRKLRFVAISEDEWRQRSPKAEVVDVTPPQKREAWVEKVVEWFGEDAVTVVDE
ncbi:DNA polymerase III subunit gamma/tau [Ferroacidibacillus organovorans]|nr:DNA polymerase III subunit gamma/tau [Ferroacidibacillus organovorans]